MIEQTGKHLIHKHLVNNMKKYFNFVFFIATSIALFSCQNRKTFIYSNHVDLNFGDKYLNKKLKKLGKQNSFKPDSIFEIEGEFYVEYCYDYVNDICSGLGSSRRPAGMIQLKHDDIYLNYREGFYVYGPIRNKESQNYINTTKVGEYINFYNSLYKFCPDTAFYSSRIKKKSITYYKNYKKSPNLIMDGYSYYTKHNFKMKCIYLGKKIVNVPNFRNQFSFIDRLKLRNYLNFLVECDYFVILDIDFVKDKESVPEN